MMGTDLRLGKGVLSGQESGGRGRSVWAGYGRAATRGERRGGGGGSWKRVSKGVNLQIRLTLLHLELHVEPSTL